MKIFVTVGTHNQGFDTLLESLQPWIDQKEHDWVIQSGHLSRVVPGVRQYSFLKPEDFRRHLREADLVIAHLGCGIAREIQQEGKPTLFMCRRRHRGEHVDDHQLELKKALEGRPGIAFIGPEDDISAQAQRVLNEPKPKQPQELEKLIHAVNQWINTKNLINPNDIT